VSEAKGKSSGPKKATGAKAKAPAKPRAAAEAKKKKTGAKAAEGTKAGAARVKAAAAKKPAAPAAKKAKPKPKAVEAVADLELHNLRPPAGAVRKKRRLGMGPGSGRGRTSGRGHKGQKSRSGYSRKRGFEGGQMPLIRRLPKRGFTNIFRTEYAEVNVSRLETLAGEKEITPELLLANGVVKKLKGGIKILGQGELSTALTVRAHAFSAAARKKIEAAGGKAEVIEK
jgi:large subunit ribosomal protein L15